MTRIAFGAQLRMEELEVAKISDFLDVPTPRHVLAMPITDVVNVLTIQIATGVVLTRLVNH